jgi:hypothetical protein
VYSEIASNKRRNVIFIVLFFLIWLAIGAALGFLFKAVARAIERALTDRRPAAHYRVGRDTRFVLPILRHLPASIRDRLVMTNLGLTHDTFAAA